jgi:DNA modification methylase
VNKPIILMGDSLAALKDMDDNIFDLVLLDPPYFDYRTNHRKDKSDKLSQSLVQQSKDDQLETVRECIKKLKPGSASETRLSGTKATGQPVILQAL